MRNLYIYVCKYCLFFCCFHESVINFIAFVLRKNVTHPRVLATFGFRGELTSNFATKSKIPMEKSPNWNLESFKSLRNILELNFCSEHSPSKTIKSLISESRSDDRLLPKGCPWSVNSEMPDCWKDPEKCISVDRNYFPWTPLQGEIQGNRYYMNNNVNAHCLKLVHNFCFK